MSGGEIRLRAATDADGPALARVVATIFADYPNCLFVAEEFPELQAPASHYQRLGGRLWIAAEGERVVGSLAVARTADPAVFELFKVYLLKETRGLGIAGRMLDQAIALAATSGASRLRLWTDTRFVEGHRFYDKNGFRRLPVRRALADASDTWEYAYDKAIAAPLKPAP